MIDAVHTRACTGMKNGHNSVNVQNRTHVYMNFFDHKDLGNHLLQLCPKVVKHPVYICALCVLIYKHTYVYLYTHIIYVCVCIYKYIYTYIFIYTHTHTHTHIYTKSENFFEGNFQRKLEQISFTKCININIRNKND